MTSLVHRCVVHPPPPPPPAHSFKPHCPHPSPFSRNTLHTNQCITRARLLMQRLILCIRFNVCEPSRFSDVILNDNHNRYFRLLN